MHFCSCNLHGACGGKGALAHRRLWQVWLQSARSVWRQRYQVGGRGRNAVLQSARSVWRQRKCLMPRVKPRWNVAICTERVEAKDSVEELRREKIVAICTERVEAKAVCLQKLLRVSVAICTERVEAKFQRCDRCVEALPLQSARSVWRQSIVTPAFSAAAASCNLHGACGGKAPAFRAPEAPPGCNLHGACGGKG